VRPVSAKRARALRIYAAKRLRFLEANPTCARCGQWAFQIHHKAGRIGALLLDESKWLAVCGFCHDEITRNPAQAIADGWSLPRVGAA
jgi:ribosomal protein S27AE